MPCTTFRVSGAWCFQESNYITLLSPPVIPHTAFDVLYGTIILHDHQTTRVGRIFYMFSWLIQEPWCKTYFHQGESSYYENNSHSLNRLSAPILCFYENVCKALCFFPTSLRHAEFFCYHSCYCVCILSQLSFLHSHLGYNRGWFHKQKVSREIQLHRSDTV